MPLNKRLITDLESTSCGRLGVMLHDLNNGETFSHCPDERVPTASVIKLPMVIHAALLAHEGNLNWDERLTLRESDKVGGYGILRDLTAGQTFSIRDLCQLTIVLSDNTTTNMLIERLGIAAINQRITALGLLHTRLHRKAFTPNTPDMLPFGLGVTTPRDIADLLLMLLHPAAIPSAPAQMVLAMLADQRDRVGFARYLPVDWAYAGKTGADDYLRNDVGIITAPDGRRWVLAAFCHSLPGPNYTVDNPGWLALARLAQGVVQSAK